MEIIENVLVLERGVWSPERVKVHQIADRSDIRLHPGDSETIDDNWKSILAQNPKAFPGPTIRLVGHHHSKGNLILEVVPSNYRDGCVIGWFGVAMAVVTSNGYIALQKPVASITATVGRGIRVPGCTPKDTKIFDHIIKETKEEFNVDVAKDDLSIHGLIEV